MSFDESDFVPLKSVKEVLVSCGLCVFFRKDRGECLYYPRPVGNKEAFDFCSKGVSRDRATIQQPKQCRNDSQHVAFLIKWKKERETLLKDIETTEKHGVPFDVGIDSPNSILARRGELSASLEKCSNEQICGLLRQLIDIGSLRISPGNVLTSTTGSDRK